MNTRRGAIGLAFALVLSGCAPGNDASFQGWIEADLIFVSPDETGRVETLSVQEGDRVATGAPLFTVDADLQKADLQMQQAALTNAQQAFDRARDLLKTQAGTQKTFEDAEAALRAVEEELADPSAWSTPARSAESTTRHEDAKRAVDELYTRYERVVG